MTSQPAVTLSEVAQLAGVSVATASRVLNGSARAVGAELRHRVLAAAAELDYIANVHAQAIARGSSDVVGLVVHDIADPYFSTIAAGVMAAAEESGLIVSLGSTLASAERELDYVAMLRAQRARALVLAGSRTTNPAQTRRLAREVQAFRSAGGRVACVSQALLGTDTVEPANRAGAQALAVALAGLGHRRFAVLAGPETLLTARDRLEGFVAGVESAGGSVVEVLFGAFNRDGGSGSWPAEPMPPASSPSTTSWPWGRWRLCASAASPFPATCPWLVSMTSPRLGTSPRR
jgi:LacI family transcriptional regulator